MAASSRAFRKMIPYRGLIFVITLVSLLSFAVLTVMAEPPVAPKSEPTSYYVAPDGKDSDPGTIGQPWRTIQKAADTLVAGDTVYISEGTYNERVIVSQSGLSESLMITFRADGLVVTQGFVITGDYIKIEGFVVTNHVCNGNEYLAAGIWIDGSYALIQDNHFYDCYYSGVMLTANSTDCTIKNNRVERCGRAGMDVRGTNHLVTNNEIFDLWKVHGDCNSGDADGIIFFGSNHIFRENFIHSILYSRGGNSATHIDAFQCWDDPTWGKYAPQNVTIERNRIFMGDWSAQAIQEGQSASISSSGFMLEGSAGRKCSNIVIKNNIVEASKGLNIGDGENCDGLKLYNNIFRSSLSFNPSYGSTGVELRNVTNCELYNNITVDYPSAHYYITSGAGHAYDHNLMWNLDGSEPKLWDSYVLQPHDKRGIDPKFVINFTDFHLQSSSPAIDSGVAISVVTDDYDGISRPQGAGFDIGAYEYPGAPQPTSTPTLTPTATPTSTPTATPTSTPTASPTLTATPTPNPNELIIDNTDGGFSTSSSQDSWEEYTEVGGQHYGESHYYNRQIGVGQDAATWSFTVPRPGRYNVYAWWWEGSWRPTDVPYTLNYLGGSTTVRVSQQSNGGQWNLLGIFDFQDQGSVVVSDDASSGQDVVADAVRLVYVEPLPSPTPTQPPGPTPTTTPAPTPTGNLLDNGSFEEGGRRPDGWIGKRLTLEDKRVCGKAHEGSCSFNMAGTTAKKRLGQTLNMSGSAGDRFTLSGWSSANNPSSRGRAYCLRATVFHTDGTKRRYRKCFAKRTHGWQRRRRTFTVAKDYNKIVVSLLYATQSGEAWFDDVRLVAQ